MGGCHFLKLSWYSLGTESVYSAEDPGSIPGREDPLEKEMANHSSILAWKISCTEEPGGLQSMGSQSGMTEWLTLTNLII